MPRKAVQTDTATEHRPVRPCRMCQMQLRLQQLYTAHGLFNFWISGRWAPKTRNGAFWGVVSGSAVIWLYMISDEPYYCGKGRQRIRGRHLWEREAAIVTDIMQSAGVGAQRLAAWFQERFSLSRLLDDMQYPEVEPEPESKSVVKPNKAEANAEVEADDDFDLCEVD